MGFWSAFRRAPPAGQRGHAPRADETPTDGEARDARHATTGGPTTGDGHARLASFGEPGGPTLDEALAELASARRHPTEGLALDALSAAHARRALPDRLALALASALLDRGDAGAAARILGAVDTAAALALRADLLAEKCDYPGAIATIERAILRDFDLPGAVERRSAWRARLGLAPAAPRVDPAQVTIASAAAARPASFELVREVARGGTGVVFEARDRSLDRTVAVKVYHRAARDRAQLLHEGRVAADLDGEGILRVLDVDPDEGWLAFEWAALGSLRDRLRPAGACGLATAGTGGGPVLAELGAWVPDLARALARVHAAGWVHHDVKPANVLLSSDGGSGAGFVPWLADFGSARRAGDPAPPGSLGYVSPERLAGGSSHPSDDVYGFGRVVEDVVATLETVASAPPADGVLRWRSIAAACVAPRAARPADGTALVRLITAGDHG
jgi:serine/threonine-protein kinase